MDRITAQQAAEKWNVSVRTVQDHCVKGRIPGAERWGRTWMIPADAKRPLDGRSREAKTVMVRPQPLIRKSPFLDMTDLYQEPGTAEECIKSLAAYPEAKQLFTAQILYSRGEVDKVYAHADQFLKSRTGFYAILSGGLLLSLCAMWKGDLQMWNRARRRILEAPCKNDVDRDIVLLTIAAADSSIRNTNEFPDWFMRGCFSNLPADAHPAAWVYYAKHLLISAQDLATGSASYDGVYGFGLMKTMPHVLEPLISQVVVDKVFVVEIYLRILLATAYHQCGEDVLAAEHLDKAIRLCLPDKLYGPLVEHRRQLGTFLDDRLALIDPNALKKVKELHKQLHIGWTNLHNAILHRRVQSSLTNREREVARLASYGMQDRQIAAQLHLSESSVKAAIKTVKNKTGVNTRKELADYI